MTITVVRAGARPPASRVDEVVVTTGELRSQPRSRLLARALRFRHGRMLTHRLRTLGRPLGLAALVRASARGACWIEDETGARRDLTLGLLSRWGAGYVADLARRRSFVHHVERTVAAIECELAAASTKATWNLAGQPVYARTDLTFGLEAGGSVGHTAGVLNHLPDLTGAPVFITTDDLPTIRGGIETHRVSPREEFWNFNELPALALNAPFLAEAIRAIGNRDVAFVYQRYSINTFAGVQLAKSRGVPFVLEYNGSEVWVSRHWGTRLRYEALTERIERLNLAAADLIVVVSRALADELAARGVERERILVNPNAVDPDRYSPAIDGSPVRRRLDLEGKTVLGFIGTFGPWHGAEVLADAFVRLMSARLEWREAVRLVWIGDGVRLPAVRSAISRAGLERQCVFTGLVPQAEGPAYMAACDVLVSPHVPNADGTPFFGSPTKLFEYMAMGKGIVASNLDQIGEMLEHGRTAWLVPPGDAAALASGLERLIADPVTRAALGAEARRVAVRVHTWRHHTRRTLDRLREMVDVRDGRAPRTARA